MKKQSVKKYKWEIVAKAKPFLIEIKKKHINAFAAHTAFFILLSLIPMLIAICALLTYTPISQETLSSILTSLTPNSMDQMAEDIISEIYDQSIISLTISLVIVLWSAGKGVMALKQGLNAINGVEEKRNFFVQRAIAAFYALVFLVVFVLFMLTVLINERFAGALLRYIPQLQYPINFFMSFRFPVLLVLMTFGFAALYALVPNKKMKFREQVRGAIFASLSWSIFSWGFSIYIDVMSAESIYGSLSGVIFLMLWLYFGVYIIMIGACINNHYMKKKRRAVDKKQSK